MSGSVFITEIKSYFRYELCGVVKYPAGRDHYTLDFRSQDEKWYLYDGLKDHIRGPIPFTLTQEISTVVYMHQ